MDERTAMVTIGGVEYEMLMLLMSCTPTMVFLPIRKTASRFLLCNISFYKKKY